MWLLEHGAVSALTPAPRTRRAILASAGGSRAPRAPPAPSQRAQRARAEARQRASRGSGAPHGPPRCRATPAQGHRRSTCTPGREEGLYVVLRPAQSRPTRPARTWLACSGHSSWRCGRPGDGIQRRVLRHRPKSRASRREALYSVLRPTQSRPACSARAWWACSDAPLGPRGGIQRTVRLHPVLWVSRPSGVLGWLS